MVQRKFGIRGSVRLLMQVGDLVSFSVYKPSARVFMQTIKGVIIGTSARGGELYWVISDGKKTYNLVQNNQIRLISKA
jgi:hypothetical protein